MDYKRVLLLHFTNGLSSRDIAEAANSRAGGTAICRPLRLVIRKKLRKGFIPHTIGDEQVVVAAGPAEKLFHGMA